MTEEEARTKWCPFVRLRFNEEVSYNRLHALADFRPFPEGTSCIASDCAMWDPEGRCGLKQHVPPLMRYDPETHSLSLANEEILPGG